MTFEIIQIFEEWGQTLAPTISAMVSASRDRLCLKDVNKGMADVKEKPAEIFIG